MKKLFKTIFKRGIRHPVEALGAGLVFLTAKILPVEIASNFGGWVGRHFSKYASASKTGRQNLKAAMPELSDAEIEKILESVWDNFARVMLEYPNLKDIDIYNDPRFEIRGQEYIEQMRDDGKPAIIIGAHLASWEVAIMALTQKGVKTTQIYRRINNPMVDKIVRSIQTQIGYEVLNKGAEDGRRVLECIKRGDHLFILNDQKLREGIVVPFFGRPAQTASASVRLAIKYKCPLVPVRVERLGGFKFRITFYPPMKIPQNPDINEAIHETVVQINMLLEEWIRKRPGQWLWIHQRWRKEG